MTTLALILLMMGGLFIWAGITDNSIVGLVGQVLSGKKNKNG